jgi:hypothetical protein
MPPGLLSTSWVSACRAILLRHSDNRRTAGLREYFRQTSLNNLGKLDKLGKLESRCGNVARVLGADLVFTEQNKGVLRSLNLEFESITQLPMPLQINLVILVL